MAEKPRFARVFLDRNADAALTIRAMNKIARELGHPLGRPDTGEGYSIWVTEETFRKWKATAPSKRPKPAAKKIAKRGAPEGGA